MTTIKGRTSIDLPGLRGSDVQEADTSSAADDYGLHFTQHTLNKHVENIYVQAEEHRQQPSKDVLHQVLDISSVLSDGASAILDDSFWRCFASAPPDPWNWNAYLFPLWCCGVVVRFVVLFPLRLLALLGGFVVFFICFAAVQLFVPASSPQRTRLERSLVQFQTSMFVASWTGVIKFHGPAPVPAANRVWVANHTSMIDYIILCSYRPFAAIMQLHPGWVGFLQKNYLSCLGCLWFHRTQVQDRQLVHEKMKAHVKDGNSTPLLIFPEGTCVNNEYCVMFKRGAFDLGATVCPVAIKYNKIFVDAFWNSRRQSFSSHLLKLMTSWAVVCDVYFLEPQTRREDESVDEFADRVRRLIAKQARLHVVQWDGYLKYYNLAEKRPQLVEKRRKVFADRLRVHLPPELQHGASGSVLSTPEKSQQRFSSQGGLTHGTKLE